MSAYETGETTTIRPNPKVWQNTSSNAVPSHERPKAQMKQLNSTDAEPHKNYISCVEFFHSTARDIMLISVHEP